jgi:nucleoside-diphosphate-sugar epimerase
MKKPKIAITGGRGYLGSILASKFQIAGWETTLLVREAREKGEVAFQLGNRITPEVLREHQAFVHCAYDFKPSSWAEIYQANILGSRFCFEAAIQAGVGRRVFVSSMSAYEGCYSMYGKAKLAVEQEFLPRGVFCVRPGLLWSYESRGMFGKLARAARTLPLIPLVDGGSQKLALSQVEDLAVGIVDYCQGGAEAPIEAQITAYPELLTFREILDGLAKQAGRNPRFFSVPGWAPLAGLRVAEFLKISLPFRSDSLVSLLHQDPSPTFSKMILFREWAPRINRPAC